MTSTQEFSKKYIKIKLYIRTSDLQRNRFLVVNVDHLQYLKKLREDGKIKYLWPPPPHLHHHGFSMIDNQIDIE